MIEPILAEHNRNKCSFCPNNIEKGTYYLSVDYASQFGGSRKNICLNCMLRGIIMNLKNKKEIMKRIDLMIKQEVINNIR